MMDELLDIGFFEDFDDGEALPETVIPPDYVEETYYERSRAYWMQIPMPPGHAPCGGNPLALLDDETLLTMSPALIVHAQRTAAMGGMQIVSPRAISLASMAARTDLSHRTSDMFLVGSNANRNLDWPVVSEPVSAHLFPGEPIDAYPAEIAPRPKVVSTGLMSSTRDISDPITKAFLLGRAIVDLQRRVDVAGSGRELARLIASCWGITEEAFEDMAEASLAPVGELLRYAIRADDSYPIINAPVQARKCISVGANTAGRALYGEHAALDWRRLRVLAESVYYQSIRTEGYTLTQMAVSSPPGDPKAPPDRMGLLQFRPMPGTIWTHAPETFRLDIVAGAPVRCAVRLPDRVGVAVQGFYDGARPTAVAASHGVERSLVPSVARTTTSATSEAVISGFKTVMSVNAAFSVRGKTSSAAVRDFIYQSLSDNASLHAIRALWMVRYLRETAEAFGLTNLLDEVTTRHVASRLSDLTADLRIKLSVEANRRGATLDEWWDDLRAMLPSRLAALSEGSATWAIAIAHLLIHPSTRKWETLARAMAHVSHGSLASTHVRDLKIPARLGSRERVFEAAAATVRSLGASYGAFYGAMYDVASILAAQLKRAGNMVAHHKLIAAGLMWDIRSKAASTVALHMEDGTSETAGVYQGHTARFHLTIAPYAAYTRWLSHINSERVVALEAKQSFPHHTHGRVEDAFQGREMALFPLNGQGSTRLFRYAANPSRLATDLRKTLNEILADMSAVVRMYEEERPMTDFGQQTHEPAAVATFDLARYAPAANSYWALLPTLEPEVAVELDEAVSRLSQEDQDAISSATYETGAEMLRRVFEVVDGRAAARARTSDAVR